MLDLEICRKCWQSRNVVWRPEAKYTIRERGFVFCANDNTKAEISGNPSTICPYKLEHAIAAALGSNKCSDA